ncbi:serine/threonine protein kinase [Alsobacter soli]|uniref:Serine/threonine protein kinase n=1 Tax=Alsobacter soli TaxID=2109933 RepID=A0A2T1HV64_9HYPH|nr:serine/threonine-protein kinase [Alsobacter soli]PSC05531.1 serine/threonine protein kinase [Alsobacter soli]
MGVTGRHDGGIGIQSVPALVPARVGKYRIDGIIGRGAIGLVYKGHDEQIDRPLAIKTLRPEVLEDFGEKNELLKRFAAEARSAGRCLHPNIVTVFDFVEHEGAPYIVMEFVDAGTLENVLKSGALLPMRQVGEIMAQLLFALGYAHSKGVIHRDVKPANILCPSAASIKVSDFGVAHVDSLNLTKPGGMGPVGTPNYMAPERFLGRPADARSDLFSAGVVLFQLLTHAKPFVATDLPDLMRKLMNEPAPAPSSLRPEIWPELDGVVARALARNPDDRFASAESFVDALNAAVDARPNDLAPPLDLSCLSMRSTRPTASAKEELNRTMADRLSPTALEKLSQSLARALGPIARLIVRQASREATDAETLVATLAQHIKTEPEAAFFKRMATETLLEDIGLAAARIEEAISETERRVIVDALLPLIGPVARVLVARQAETAVGRDDFYGRLAARIPNEIDRAHFLALRDKLRPAPHA